MTVTAPPRPPRPSNPVEREEVEALVEALIEEARQRARRRRQRYAGMVLLAFLVGIALYAGFGRGGSDSATSVASAALTASGAPSTGQAFSLSFRLLSVETSFRRVDSPPRGVLNEGDAIYVKDELRNGWSDQFGRPRNALVGSDSWVRSGLSTPGWELVKVKVTLPGGTLRLRFRGQVSGSTIVLRVVGGTGDFAKARGALKWQQRGNGPSLNDYRLRLP